MTWRERLEALRQRVAKTAIRGQDVALCIFRKWWRPITCAVAVGTVAVNGIYLPLKLKTAADLVGLAAVLAALAPFAIAREIGKALGTSENV